MFPLQYILNFLSFFAVVLTCICNIPQIYYTIQTKDVSGFSYKTMILRIVIAILWLIYAILDKQLLLSVSAFVAITSESTLTYLKYKYTIPNKNSMTIIENKNDV